MERLNQLRAYIEKNSFGVCTYVAEKLNMRVSQIRLFFIYITVATMGSSVIFYILLGFWLNVKHYLRKSFSLIK